MKTFEYEMSDKIVVFSDIHAQIPGGGQKKIDKLVRPHLQGAAMVIFNGDTLNWTSNYKLEKTSEVVDYINRVCLEDGVKPLILAGNADYLISENHFFFHEQSKTLVFHGEVVYPEVSPWRLESKLLKNRYDFFMKNAVGGDTDINVRFQAAKHVINIYEFDDSFQKKLYYRFPWIINPVSWFHLLNMWKTFPQKTADFAKYYYPDVKHVVVGHFHKAGVWDIDGVQIICTGAFQKFLTQLMVTIQGSNIEITKIKSI